MIWITVQGRRYSTTFLTKASGHHTCKTSLMKNCLCMVCIASRIWNMEQPQDNRWRGSAEETESVKKAGHESVDPGSLDPSPAHGAKGEARTTEAWGKHKARRHPWPGQVINPSCLHDHPTRAQRYHHLNTPPDYQRPRVVIRTPDREEVPVKSLEVINRSGHQRPEVSTGSSDPEDTPDEQQQPETSSTSPSTSVSIESPNNLEKSTSKTSSPMTILSSSVNP